jgi:threonine aldolase
MPWRLHEDHANARFLAEALANTPGIQVDLATVQTNIVIFDVSGTGRGSAELSALWKANGVLINPVNAMKMRLVTHCDVDRKACEDALAVIRKAIVPVTAPA